MIRSSNVFGGHFVLQSGDVTPPPDPPSEPVPPATVVNVTTANTLATINAIPADRTIQFADGTYSLGGTIVPKTGQYYLGNLSNPAAVVLQGTGNFRAFNGGGAIAPGCVIKSLKITGYDCGMGRSFVPNPTGDVQDGRALLGAIEQASGWQILDCHVVANYCSGMTIGNGTRVARCLINDNGHKGIGGGIEANSCRARDLLIEDNQIDGNCLFDMNKTWDSGGIKLIGGATPGGLNPALNPAANNTFRRNRISRNNGPGIWWDWDVHDGEIANNSIFLNHASGIVIEASATAHIHHNQIGDNCTGSLPALITFRCNTVGVQNSKRCLLEDNLFYVNRELAGALTQHNRATGAVNTPKGGIYVGWFTGVENEWSGNVWLMEANGLFSAQLDNHSCSNSSSSCTGVSCSFMCGTVETGCDIAATPTGPTIGGNFMCFIPQAADNHLNVQDGDTFRIASGTANKWFFQTNSTQITGSFSAYIPDWDVIPSWTTPPGK